MQLTHYHLREKPTDDVTLSFLNQDGKEIKTFRSKPDDGTVEKMKDGATEEKTAPKEVGLNRFVWNMRYPDARNFQGAIYRSSGVTGPLAPPGTYQVRLTVGDQSSVRSFEIRKDPRIEASDAELRTQFALLLQIRDKLSETNDAIVQIRTLRSEIGAWEGRAKQQSEDSPLVEAAKALREGLTSVEEELVQTRWKSSRDALTAPSKLNVKLATLLGVVGGADAAPTTQSQAVFASVSERLDRHMERLDTMLGRDVPRFNTLVREQDLPALTVVEGGGAR